MKHRIVLWALAGILVAVGWAVAAAATKGPWIGSHSATWILVDITCPIALLRSYPLSIYFVLFANALTYAIVGLGVEYLRLTRTRQA